MVDAQHSDNPYQAPVDLDHQQAELLPLSNAEFSLPATFGTKKFMLHGFADRLQIAGENGSVFEQQRSEPMFAKLIHGTIVRHSLRLKFDRPYLYKLSGEDFQTLKRWIGDPTTEDLREALGSTSWWQIPVGAIFLFSAFQIDGSISFYNLAIAVLCLALFFLVRFKPARWVFLLSATIFALFAGRNALDFYNTYSSNQSISWFSGLFVLFCLNLVAWNVRQYFAYRNIRSAAADHQTEQV